jgi:hypothetical protein
MNGVKGHGSHGGSSAQRFANCLKSPLMVILLLLSIGGAQFYLYGQFKQLEAAIEREHNTSAWMQTLLATQSIYFGLDSGWKRSLCLKPTS